MISRRLFCLLPLFPTALIEKEKKDTYKYPENPEPTMREAILETYRMLKEQKKRDEELAASIACKLLNTEITYDVSFDDVRLDHLCQ